MTISRWATVVAAGMLLASAIGVEGPQARGYELDWYTIDGGGATWSAGGGYELGATIGQADAGAMTGGAYALAGGFWFTHPQGDCNGDGVVSVLDYVDLEACLDGPTAGLGAPSCACFDFDEDDNVDLEDFAEFQVLFTG